MYMYHSFLIHSSADGHLGCFRVILTLPQAAHQASKEVPAPPPGAAEQQAAVPPEAHLPRSPERDQVRGLLLLTMR